MNWKSVNRQGEAPVVPGTGYDPSLLTAGARITDEGYHFTKIDVAAQSEKYLVVSYLYRPWWRATIDGEKTEIYRACGGFMCIRIPPGKHSVRFRYYPKDVCLVILLALLALASPFLGIRKIF